nr:MULTISPECIES: Abi family protein [unclassified Actinomyces]
MDLLVERGLSVPDRTGALRDLQTYGYHRLGGYRYPLRQLLPDDEQDPAQRRFRSDEFIEGASHDDVMRLYKFDRRLREVVLQGVLEYEARLRSALIGVVSVRGAYAHLDQPRDSLDPRKTAQQQKGSSATLLERWEHTVRDATHDARQSDAVAHHLVAYENTPPPIWIALDVVSFGSLPYFMDLMRDEDRNAVARLFGVRNGNALTRWTRAFVDLRNICAHDLRLFNSNVKRKITIQPSQVPADALQHLRGHKSPKIYMHLTLLAYVLRSHPAESRWHLPLRTQIRKLPTGIRDGSGAPLDLTVMGFPENWETLAPWQDNARL